MKPTLRIHSIMASVVFCSILACCSALAMPARNTVVTMKQPDGTSIKARLFGDEWYHFTETEDGYTIVKDQNGWWRYAQLDETGTFKPSDMKVTSRKGRTTDEILFINGLSKHLRESEHIIDEYFDNLYLEPLECNSHSLNLKTVLPDTERVVVILVDYPDYRFTYSVESFDSLMNAENYNGSGSVNDYLHTISYRKLSIKATVVGWYTAPESLHYYRWDRDALVRSLNRVHQLVRWAVEQADMTVDFSQFDNDSDQVVDRLFILHAGPGAEDNGDDQIWSHRHYLNWFYDDHRYTSDGVMIDGYAIVPEKFGCNNSHVRIGVFCHEYGHLLGLPDLYDPDGSSYGIGTWGLMGLGGWGGDCNSPEVPSHMCAWSKMTLGWVYQNVPIRDFSGVALFDIERYANVYKLWTNGDPSSEYFLIENRQKIGFDESLPDSGILIWHIDETVVDGRGRLTNRNEHHKAVDLEEADGFEHMDRLLDKGNAGDLFHVGDTFNLNTNPSSKSNRGHNTFIEVSVDDYGFNTFLFSYKVESSQIGAPDLVIRDCLDDDGDEPNDACLNDFASSPDIWIDNDGDGEPDPQAPGVINRLWARIWNIGDGPATDVRVSFWRAKPTLGLQIPEDMTRIFDETTGDSVVVISLLPANQTIGADSGVVVFLNVLLPEPPYCFAVTVENDEDTLKSMFPLENNNIAQFNMWSERRKSVPGGAVAFRCTLLAANPTNAMDLFEIKVRSSLFQTGWTMNVEPSTIELAPEEFRPITLDIMSPEAVEHGDSGFVFTELYQIEDTNTSVGSIIINVGIDNTKPKTITTLTAVTLCPEGDDFPADLATVQLTWQPVQADSAGNDEKIWLYYIYRDTSDNVPLPLSTVVDSVAADEDMLLPEFQWKDYIDLTPGMTKTISLGEDIATYYYKVISVDRAGNRSDPSNEVSPVEVPCDDVVGACCLNGTCVATTEANCQANGGTYKGDGSECLGDGNQNGIDDVCEGTCMGTRGDPTGDGTINVLDVLAVVNHILGISELTDDAFCRGDCNADGIINILDALGIVNALLGISECAPDACKSEVTPETLKLLESLRWHLSAADFARLMELVKAEMVEIPAGYCLSQNCPNPFNPVTDIQYQIADDGIPVRTTLRIYNILGQEVRTLVDEVKEPGCHKATWDGKDAFGKTVASGIYLYKLTAGDFTAAKRMVLMK
jgi:M6 family metalloprotease-like protein